MNSTLQYLRHYFRGAAASGFNGGGSAVVAIIAAAQVFTAHSFAHAFGVAFVVHAFIYFGQNPLPVIVPEARSVCGTESFGPGGPVKAAPVIVALLLLATLSGCSLVPDGKFESGSFSLTVGPFFAQEATATGVAKNADGSGAIGNFTGSTSYLGVITTRQTIHDWTTGPKAAAAAPAK